MAGKQKNTIVTSGVNEAALSVRMDLKRGSESGCKQSFRYRRPVLSVRRSVVSLQGDMAPKGRHANLLPLSQARNDSVEAEQGDRSKTTSKHLANQSQGDHQKVLPVAPLNRAGSSEPHHMSSSSNSFSYWKISCCSF